MIRIVIIDKGSGAVFDFSCMVEIEVDNVYNYILRRTIMKTQKVDRGV